MENVLSFTTNEQEIINVLNQVTREAYIEKVLTGDANWTLRIKELLGQLGTKLGYETCTSGFSDIYHCEWLYDLVWYKNDEEGFLESVPLVMESEWQRHLGGIKFDFEKLLLANSESKLMICQAGNKLEQLRSYFKNAVQRYAALKKGERFLIAILDDYYEGEFVCDLIVKE